MSAPPWETASRHWLAGTSSPADSTFTVRRPPERFAIRSARRSAPEPSPAMPFGQAVTIFHSVLSWAMAGLGNAEATLAPAVKPAPARNPRRFIQWPPDTKLGERSRLIEPTRAGPLLQALS